jgi:hypothetical protein
MATQAIKSVIPGYVAGEPKRYSESLKKNFVLGRKDGYEFVDSAPASLGGATNPADLTGAPASFYHHASGRLTQAREELRKLEPLSDSDYEESCEDIRLVIRAKLDELESAFGAECGPCEEWVNQILVLLLGHDAASDDDDEIEEDDRGLVGRMEDAFTKDASAHCPGEELRLAKVRLFRSTLISLGEEWDRFADEFIHGEQVSPSIVVRRLGSRLVVVCKSLENIRHGLAAAGYSTEQLTVESLEDPEDEDEEPLTACCAFNRLENFAAVRGLALLQQPGPGAFHSLAIESDQLTALACSVRSWLMGKLINSDELDDCLSEQRKFAGGSITWIKAAQGTGAINLCFQGVMASALTLWQQMRAFHEDATLLLESVDKISECEPDEEEEEEVIPKTTRRPAPRKRAKAKKPAARVKR